MTLLRDLVSRVTFRTDLTPLHQLDRTLDGVKSGIAAIAGTALSGWAIKAGGDIDFLHNQINTRFGAGLGEVKDKIDELAAEKGGLASIFSEKDLIQGSIALSRLGFSGKESAQLLEQASTLLSRSGTGIAETVEMLGRGIQEGGLTDTLRAFGFFSRETAEDFKIIEEAIGQAAGPLSARAMRQTREALARILEQNREKLEKERGILETSAAGANMRVGSQMENLWNRITRTITETMMPALNQIAGILEKASTFVEALRKDIVRAGGAAEAFFQKMEDLFPDHTEHVESAREAWRSLTEFVDGLFDSKVGASATIGGILMFLLTRNPKWILGGVLTGTLLSQFNRDWLDVEGMLKKDVSGLLVGGTIGGLLAFLATGNPFFILGGITVGASLGEMAQKFLDEKNFGVESTEETKEQIARGALERQRTGGTSLVPLSEMEKIAIKWFKQYGRFVDEQNDEIPEDTAALEAEALLTKIQEAETRFRGFRRLPKVPEGSEDLASDRLEAERERVVREQDVNLERQERARLQEKQRGVPTQGDGGTEARISAPVMQEKGEQPREEEPTGAALQATQEERAVSFTWHGDMIIDGSQNPDQIAQQLRRELASIVRMSVLPSLVPTMEG